MRSNKFLKAEQAPLVWDAPGLLAGVDEAGRGPLAGPVVAAAVILDDRAPIKGLGDSKQLSAARRDRLYDEIRAKALCCCRPAEQERPKNRFPAHIVSLYRGLQFREQRTEPSRDQRRYHTSDPSIQP